MVRLQTVTATPTAPACSNHPVRPRRRAKQAQTSNPTTIHFLPECMPLGSALPSRKHSSHSRLRVNAHGVEDRNSVVLRLAQNERKLGPGQNNRIAFLGLPQLIYDSQESCPRGRQ